MSPNYNPSNGMAYIETNSSAVADYSPDYFNVGAEILDAISLNDGLTDGDASNARVLTQTILQPDATDLNPVLPSPAEALAAMLAFNALQCSVDSSFNQGWVSERGAASLHLLQSPPTDFQKNYSTDLLDTPVTEPFPALVQTQEYTSGGIYPYQRAFYVVLFPVFLINIFLLAQFLRHGTLLHDFFEPRTLFSLAISSPACHIFGRPDLGKLSSAQYSARWHVEKGDGGRPRIVAMEGSDGDAGRGAASGWFSRRLRKRRERRSNNIAL
jgi:hypothetical protein